MKIATINPISLILIIVTAVMVTFYSSFFFLGNEESFMKLKEEAFKNVLFRALLFLILSIPSYVIILLIELFSKNRTKNEAKMFYVKMAIIFSIFVASSLIGTLIFYYL